MGLIVEKIESRSGFRALEPEWNRLLERSAAANIFLTWEWVSTWWNVFGGGRDPWVLTARDDRDNSLVGLLPFELRGHPSPGHGPVRELSFMGCTHGDPDHLDAIAVAGREGELASAITEYLHWHRRHWDVVRLDGMASHSRLTETLLQHGGGGSRSGNGSGLVWRSVCPFVTLPGTVDEFRASQTRKVRYNLRSRARRLAGDTKETVRYHTVEHEHEIAGALSALSRVHEASRRAHGDTSQFGSAATSGFHAAVARSALARGWLRLHFLYVGMSVVAAAYCFNYRDVTYFYQTGHDPAWARYGPGSAIVDHAITTAIEERSREFDFLRGVERYKFQWTDQTRSDLRVRLATTTKGRVWVSTLRVGLAARGTLRQWRERRTTRSAMVGTRA